MTGSFPTTRRIELLLRSASGAHYACRSLLEEARQELDTLPELVPLRDAVGELLECVEHGLGGPEFDARLALVLDVAFDSMGSGSGRRERGVA
jgi:hypothetical protein